MHYCYCCYMKVLCWSDNTGTRFRQTQHIWTSSIMYEVKSRNIK